MNIFTRTFVIVAAACLLAAIFAPALAVDAVDRPIDVSDALRATTHDALAELGIVKMHALADLLSGVTDETSARERAPGAERYCLELELLNARSRMLPPVPPAVAITADTHSRRYAEAKYAMDAQLRRLNDAEPLARQLPALAPLLRAANESDHGDALPARAG